MLLEENPVFNRVIVEISSYLGAAQVVDVLIVLKSDIEVKRSLFVNEERNGVFRMVDTGELNLDESGEVGAQLVGAVSRCLDTSRGIGVRGG